jgi:hypothetical protein
MGERIDRFKREEWAEIERLPWPAEVTLPGGARTVLEGSMEFGIPPERFRPLVGDIYITPGPRVHMHREGAAVPPGSKFPILKTWKREVKPHGSNPV